MVSFSWADLFGGFENVQDELDAAQLEGGLLITACQFGGK
jgi:hypothetical protein